MAKIADFFVELGLKKDKFDKGLKEVERAPSKINNAFSGLGGQIAAAFSVTALLSFSKSIINVTAEFQKFQAVLTNTLGSGDLAGIYLKQITEFASETPFSVQQLTGAFVKLANQGFVPSQKEMVKLGDIASSTGKSFDQLAEAIIDASTGQFERLKEFGIKAAANGDKVAFSFKGVTTEVDNTSSAIRNYILGLGDAEGVTGAMAAISETLGGKISNLGDSWDQFMLAIGNSEGPLKGTIEVISSKLNELTTVINNKTIPAWQKWLATLNVGPYRGRILRDADAAKNEADQAAWRAEQFAVPAFDYQSIIEATTKSEKELAEARKKNKEALEQKTKAVQLAAEMAEKLLKTELDLVDLSGIGNVGENLFSKIDPSKIDIEELDIQPLEIPINVKKFNEDLIATKEAWTNFTTSLGSSINDFLAGAVSELFTGIGEALTGGQDLDSVFLNILGGFGKFLSQMGAMMISYGIAEMAFFTSFAEGPFGAAKLIAAGAALALIGGAISGLASQASKGINSSGTSGVGGGAQSSLDYIMNGANQQTLSASIKGSDLVFVLEREQRNKRGV